MAHMVSAVVMKAGECERVMQWEPSGDVTSEKQKLYQSMKTRQSSTN
jgi:hypothetical protein